MKQDMMNFYQEYLINGDNCRKISIWVYGQNQILESGVSLK